MKSFLNAIAVCPLILGVFSTTAADRSPDELHLTDAAMFLLEAVLGLEDEDLYTKYELTSFSKYGKRSRNGKVFQHLIRKLDEYGDKADPYRKKAVAYLQEIGVSRADLESIRNIFLEKIIR